MNAGGESFEQFGRVTAGVDQAALPACVNDDGFATVEKLADAQCGGNGEELVFGVKRPSLQGVGGRGRKIRDALEVVFRELLEFDTRWDGDGFDAGRFGGAPASGVQAGFAQFAGEFEKEAFHAALYAGQAGREKNNFHGGRVRVRRGLGNSPAKKRAKSRGSLRQF